MQQGDKSEELDATLFKYFDTMEELLRVKDTMCQHMKKGYNGFSFLRSNSGDEDAAKINLPTDCDIKPFLTVIEFISFCTFNIQNRILFFLNSNHFHL